MALNLGIFITALFGALEIVSNTMEVVSAPMTSSKPIDLHPAG